jgi:thioredoxin-like negative regulator of GroEL
MSETMKDVMNGFKKDGLAQDTRAAEELSRIRTLMNARRYKEAQQAIDALPYHLRNSKTVRLTAISNAQNLDEATYLSAIEAFRQLYPEKGLYDLVLLDGYVLNKQYDLALQAINNVDNSVGGDPALNYYRALMYYRKEDTASYTRLLEKACAQVPDFQPAVLELIAHYLSEGNKAAADRYIANYQSQKNFDQERLQQVIANFR